MDGHLPSPLAINKNRLDDAPAAFAARVGSLSIFDDNSIIKPAADPDDNIPGHLRLGISVDGIYHFLKLVGFYIADEVDGEFDPYDGKYSLTYRRAADLEWVDAAIGPLTVEGGEIDISSITGYDLCSFLRTWLVKNGHTELSVCEVILKDTRFKALRHHISPANIFYSHIQSTPPHHTFQQLSIACEEFDEELPTEELFCWLDYFSLRQNVNDFCVDAVVSLIKDIGTTVAEVDHFELAYLKRSFCILELFATVDGGAKLLCQTECFRSDMADYLAGDPVSSKNAVTRRKEDKEAIDGFICSAMGFEAFDKTVHDAILASCTTPEE
jgi:hypothetical protein